jgi:cytoskeleton protein RodZ
VFVRALATSICRHIKTDSAPILAALPQTAHAKLMDDQSSKGLNQTFRAANDPKPSLLKVPMSMPMMAGALVLLLAALVLIFLPDMAKRQETKKTEIVEAVVPMPPVLVPSEVASAPLPTAPLPTASIPTAVVSSAPSAPPASAAVVAVASAPAVVVPVVATSGSILRMTAKGQVWIEVKDSKGVVLVQRTLQAKEVVNVSGQPPLAVVVGRINEMQSIEVRGKPFSLAGLSPDNVARFEVK